MIHLGEVNKIIMLTGDNKHGYQIFWWCTILCDTSTTDHCDHANVLPTIQIGISRTQLPGLHFVSSLKHDLFLFFFDNRGFFVRPTLRERGFIYLGEGFLITRPVNPLEFSTTPVIAGWWVVLINLKFY